MHAFAPHLAASMRLHGVGKSAPKATEASLPLPPPSALPPSAPISPCTPCLLSPDPIEGVWSASSSSGPAGASAAAAARRFDPWVDCDPEGGLVRACCCSCCARTVAMRRNAYWLLSAKPSLQNTPWHAHLCVAFRGESVAQMSTARHSTAHLTAPWHCAAWHITPHRIGLILIA